MRNQGSAMVILIPILMSIYREFLGADSDCFFSICYVNGCKCAIYGSANVCRAGFVMDRRICHFGYGLDLSLR
ncbi:hypothetical protein AXFE_25600 [Acidithrix ferrooxidans]|uniref:Uncharacterized protein n=1 Tax=Acidithrix ferrooxidans TaxID=1280514 RepID=A0A0D8HFM2_9ACTN|nr:hypothetical protein AXFE_25600 [Acidithrix ferrooxidans]